MQGRQEATSRFLSTFDNYSKAEGTVRGFHLAYKLPVAMGLEASKHVN